jgi:hypothetical protein
MAITRKPLRSGSEGGAVDVDALINKGGSAPLRDPAAKEANNREGGTVPIVLRLPTELLEQVDSLLRARPVRLPRHTWILEAVYEKMKRESEAPHE